MPGGNKEGGGLKSSPVYKMKGFSGFGNSPVKQKIPKIDMTLNDNLNKAVKRITPVTRTGSRATYDAMKNLNVPRVTGPVSAGGTNPPKGVNLEKNYTKGMRNRLASSKQKWNTGGSVFEEPSTKRKFSKSARNIGKKGFGKSLAKFFGGKTLGIGGFMFGTLGTGLTMEAQNREKFGVKPTKPFTKSQPTKPFTKSQIKDVSKELTKAVYEGNKKRYGKSK